MTRLTTVIPAISSGGAERVMATMANYWAARDWEITLLTFDDGSIPPFYALDPRIAHRPLGVAKPSPSRIDAIKNNLTRIATLRRAIKASRPDVVISFLDATNVATLLATRGLRVPVIVEEHTDPAKKGLTGSWARLRRLLYPRADRVVVLSEQSRRYFSPTVQARTIVIPNPIAVSAAGTPMAPSSRKTLIALGRLGPEKGFDLLLDAFARIAPDHPDWRLTIWGEGDLRAELEAQRARLGLDDRVDLPGRTANPHDELRAADLFVMSSRREGFPMALGEAMACGLPVVSADCASGPRQIIRPGIDGVLVPPEDAAALAAALDQLMRDPGERARLAARAPEVLDRFGIERVMAIWESVIAGVVAGRKSPRNRTNGAPRPAHAPASDAYDEGRARQLSRLLGIDMGTAAMKITFLTRALDFGGAERQLVELARGLHARGHQIKVVVFYAGGPLERELHEAGVPVVVLDKRGRYDAFGFGLRLARALRDGNPDVVHGYLGGPNTFSALLKPVHRAVVVWGVRTSTSESLGDSWIRWLDGQIERKLARLPRLTIANSHAGKAFAIAGGFPRDRIVVVPNGVDTEKFKPDPAGRARVRAEFGVADETPLIGRIGRVVPQKGYRTFVEMAGLVLKSRPNARFMVVGDGEDEHAAELRARAETLGIADRIIWTGARNDMGAVYSALDLSVSSSAFSEGVPNVIAESMATGVPCVFTTVGDSEWTAGGHGYAVPPSDPAAMAAAVATALQQLDAGAIDRNALRESVIARLSLTALFERTEGALRLALRPSARAAASEPSESGA